MNSEEFIKIETLIKELIDDIKEHREFIVDYTAIKFVHFHKLDDGSSKKFFAKHANSLRAIESHLEKISIQQTDKLAEKFTQILAILPNKTNESGGKYASMGKFSHIARSDEERHDLAWVDYVVTYGDGRLVYRITGSSLHDPLPHPHLVVLKDKYGNYWA